MATSATWTLLITLSGMVSEGSTEFTTLSEGTFVELLTSLLLLRPPATEVTFSDGPLITLDNIEADDDDDVADDELVVEAGMAIMPVLAIIVRLMISNEHAN